MGRVVMYINFLPACDDLLHERRDALRRKLLVLCALGHTSLWLDWLTPLGRAITGAPDPSEVARMDAQLAEDPSLFAAIKLCVDSAEDEQKGFLDSHVEKLRRAEKIYPDIAQWYDAIFV